MYSNSTYSILSSIFQCSMYFCAGILILLVSTLPMFKLHRLLRLCRTVTAHCFLLLSCCLFTFRAWAFFQGAYSLPYSPLRSSYTFTPLSSLFSNSNYYPAPPRPIPRRLKFWRTLHTPRGNRCFLIIAFQIGLFIESFPEKCFPQANFATEFILYRCLCVLPQSVMNGMDFHY